MEEKKYTIVERNAHTPGKEFIWKFILTGNDEVDKRNMKIAFQRSIDNFFMGKPPKSYNFYSEQPERY